MVAHLPPETRSRLVPIRLLVLDVDGVLTDGSLFYSAAGEQLKRFSVRDGLAIKLLQGAGITVALLTARQSQAVAIRGRELGLAEELIIQGASDKVRQLETLEQSLGLHDTQVAAMGDDLQDLPVLRRVGFSACPADAAAEVVATCHYICRQNGGAGAVREVAELLLKGQGRWAEQISRWVGREPHG